MKPLKTIQWLLTWQSISPPDRSASLKMKIAYVAFALVIFILIFYYTTSSLILFIEFLKVDIKVTFFAFMAFTGSLALLYSLINAFQARHKINEIFEKLSAIHSESKLKFVFKVSS